MRLRTVLIIMLVLILVSVICQASEPSMVLNKAMIISCDIPTAGSGYITFWAKFIAQTEDGVKHELFIVYLGEMQSLPQVSSFYNIKYHMGYLDGEINLFTKEKNKQEKIIDDFVEVK